MIDSVHHTNIGENLARGKKIYISVYAILKSKISRNFFLTTACNPKEYYELFKNSYVNKKHKGIKKRSPGMNLENCAQRSVSWTTLILLKNHPVIIRKFRAWQFLRTKCKRKHSQKLNFCNLAIKGIVFLMELPPWPCLIPI